MTNNRDPYVTPMVLDFVVGFFFCLFVCFVLFLGVGGGGGEGKGQRFDEGFSGMTARWCWGSISFIVLGMCKNCCLLLTAMEESGTKNKSPVTDRDLVAELILLCDEHSHFYLSLMSGWGDLHWGRGRRKQMFCEQKAKQSDDFGLKCPLITDNIQKHNIFSLFMKAWPSRIQ